MARKCYYVTYVNCAQVSGDGYVCAEDLQYLPGGNCGGGYFYSVSNGFNQGNASEISGTVTLVSCDKCSGCCAPPDKPCDCLNGGCVNAATYNTPGKYANLADCQAGCAKDSPCNGVCVPTAEIVALEQAAFAAQARLACK